MCFSNHMTGGVSGSGLLETQILRTCTLLLAASVKLEVPTAPFFQKLRATTKNLSVNSIISFRAACDAAREGSDGDKEAGKEAGGLMGGNR